MWRGTQGPKVSGKNIIYMYGVHILLYMCVSHLKVVSGTMWQITNSVSSLITPCDVGGGATVVVLCVYVCVWGGGGEVCVCMCLHYFTPYSHYCGCCELQTWKTGDVS